MICFRVIAHNYAKFYVIIILSACSMLALVLEDQQEVE